MKILVIGPGAVGGYFGGRLQKADVANITFAARGKTLGTLLKEGLQVRSVDGDFDINPVDAGTLDKLKGPFDTILVCVKSYHLKDVLQWLPGLCAPHTACISFLNGLGSEASIARAVGHERAIGGVAFVGSVVKSPGVIAHTAAGELTIGRLDRKEDHRLDSFQSLCQKANIPCKVSIDIDHDLWKKLVWNAGFNAVTALGRSDTRAVLAVPASEAVIREAMFEVIRVGRAHGISLDNTLVEKTIENIRSRTGIRTSMQDDAEHEKRIETDTINGAVVAKGKERNIPTPVNQTLLALLTLLDRKAQQSSKSRPYLSP